MKIALLDPQVNGLRTLIDKSEPLCEVDDGLELAQARIIKTIKIGLCIYAISCINICAVCQMLNLLIKRTKLRLSFKSILFILAFLFFTFSL